MLIPSTAAWRVEHPARWSALAATTDLTEVDWPARRVGVFYTGRQGFGAWSNESKGIFASRYLTARHQPWIALDQ